MGWDTRNRENVGETSWYIDRIFPSVVRSGGSLGRELNRGKRVGGWVRKVWSETKCGVETVREMEGIGGEG